MLKKIINFIKERKYVYLLIKMKVLNTFIGKKDIHILYSGFGEFVTVTTVTTFVVASLTIQGVIAYIVYITDPNLIQTAIDYLSTTGPIEGPVAQVEPIVEAIEGPVAQVEPIVEAIEGPVAQVEPIVEAIEGPVAQVEPTELELAEIVFQETVVDSAEAFLVLKDAEEAAEEVFKILEEADQAEASKETIELLEKQAREAFQVLENAQEVAAASANAVKRAKVRLDTAIYWSTKSVIFKKFYDWFSFVFSYCRAFINSFF